MANSWFRLYSEFAHDPKVQILSEAMQRRLIMLFCLRGEGNKLETFHETEIAFYLRISPEELAETKRLFVKQSFIDEHWNVLKWDKRQYISDCSTSRVRRYRSGLKQDETFQKRRETDNETAPEQNRTDTDTDTEQKKPVLRAPKKRPSKLVVTASPAGLGVFNFPLAANGDYEVPQKLFSEFVAAYPGVNVMGEFAKMRAWLITNHLNQKTARGMPRFMNSWLDRTQNRNGGKSNGNGHHKQEPVSDRIQRSREQGTENRMGGGVSQGLDGKDKEPAAAEDLGTGFSDLDF